MCKVMMLDATTTDTWMMQDDYRTGGGYGYALVVEEEIFQIFKCITGVTILYLSLLADLCGHVDRSLIIKSRLKRGKGWDGCLRQKDKGRAREIFRPVDLPNLEIGI